MESYFRYWGKAEKEGDCYHLLPYHCLDVAAVGKKEYRAKDFTRYRPHDVWGTPFRAVYCTVHPSK